MSIDANRPPDLTERQLYILSALIKTYTQHPEPVSSKQLVEEHALDVSSATVRNELATLEQLGMLRSPHTSSGRVPTEKGYRYFVSRLLTEKHLSVPEQKIIRAQFDEAAQDIRLWVKTAASVLAHQTEAAALVTEPRSRAVRFKHLQLIGMHETLVLLVLVLEGGELSQQMLTLAEEASQERLSQVAAMINDLCAGETEGGIRQKSLTMNDFLAHETLDLVADVMHEAEEGSRYTIHWHGFGDILSKFEEGEGAKQALRMLDEKTMLNNVISEAIQDDENQVKVLVGGDGRFDEISELSIVVGRYGTSKLAGAISVLGPTRLRYGRAISTVRYVATLMSAMLKDVYGNGDDS